MARRTGSRSCPDPARLARRIRGEERERARSLMAACGPPRRDTLVAWLWLASGWIRATHVPARIPVDRRSRGR